MLIPVTLPLWLFSYLNIHQSYLPSNIRAICFQGDNIFGVQLIVSAIADRLLHHATFVITKDKSYRL